MSIDSQAPGAKGPGNVQATVPGPADVVPPAALPPLSVEYCTIFVSKLSVTVMSVIGPVADASLHTVNVYMIISPGDAVPLGALEVLFTLISPIGGGVNGNMSLASLEIDPSGHSMQELTVVKLTAEQSLCLINTLPSPVSITSTLSKESTPFNM